VRAREEGRLRPTARRERCQGRLEEVQAVREVDREGLELVDARDERRDEVGEVGRVDLLTARKQEREQREESVGSLERAELEKLDAPRYRHAREEPPRVADLDDPRRPSVPRCRPAARPPSAARLLRPSPMHRQSEVQARHQRSPCRRRDLPTPPPSARASAAPRARAPPTRREAARA